jgi:hypothetical protein
LHSRSNLSRLRQTNQKEAAQPQYPAFSRRAFLSLSDASLATTAIPGAIGGEGFSIERAGAALHMVTGNIVRSTIDSALFGRGVHLSFRRDGSRFELLLSNAGFPGTAVPASFLNLQPGGRGVYETADSSGLNLDFLHVAAGRGPLALQGIGPKIPQSVRRFSPSWFPGDRHAARE